MTDYSQFIKICQKTYNNKFVSATDGNLSMRSDDGNIIITRSGICKGDVTEKDLVILNSSGHKLKGEGKASTEFKIHLLAYATRPEVKAVIHTHPVYSTAFATSGQGLNLPVFPEVVLGIGKIPLCRYSTPSTDELPESMKPYIDFAWAMLLENHGLVTFGRSIEDAYFKTEKIEHAAKTLFLTRQLGREKIISRNKLKELYDISENTYGLHIPKKNRFDN